MSSLPVIEGVDGLSSCGWCCAVFDGSPVSLYGGVCVGVFPFLCIVVVVGLLVLVLYVVAPLRCSFRVVIFLVLVRHVA